MTDHWRLKRILASVAAAVAVALIWYLFTVDVSVKNESEKPLESVMIKLGEEPIWQGDIDIHESTWTWGTVEYAGPVVVRYRFDGRTVTNKCGYVARMLGDSYRFIVNNDGVIASCESDAEPLRASKESVLPELLSTDWFVYQCANPDDPTEKTVVFMAPGSEKMTAVRVRNNSESVRTTELRYENGGWRLGLDYENGRGAMLPDSFALSMVSIVTRQAYKSAFRFVKNIEFERLLKTQPVELCEK